jgi:hypothetical protein
MRSRCLPIGIVLGSIFLAAAIAGCGGASSVKAFKKRDGAATCRYIGPERYVCGERDRQCINPEHYNRPCLGPERMECCSRVDGKVRCRRYECRVARAGGSEDFYCAERIACTGMDAYGRPIYSLTGVKAKSAHKSGPLFPAEQAALCSKLCGPGEWIPDTN